MGDPLEPIQQSFALAVEVEPHVTGAARPERSAIREADLCVPQDELERLWLQVKG